MRRPRWSAAAIRRLRRLVEQLRQPLQHRRQLGPVNGSNGLAILNNAQGSVVGGGDTIDFAREHGQRREPLQHRRPLGQVNGSNGFGTPEQRAGLGGGRRRHS